MAKSHTAVNDNLNIEDTPEEVSEKMWISFESDYQDRIHDLIDKKDN